MRIGIYVSHAGVPYGFEHMASGHLQVPLHAAGLLRAAGHDVIVVSTALAGRARPAATPEGVQLVEVTDPSRQGQALSFEVGRRRGVHLLKLLRWSTEVAGLAERHRLDVLHFFGGDGTGRLAGWFRATRSPCPVVATWNVGRCPGRHDWFARQLWRRVDGVVTSTEHQGSSLRAIGIQARVVRHGPIRRFPRSVNVQDARRVVFWREATTRNGADIAMAAFQRLAPDHPDVTFEIAVRPHHAEVPGLENAINGHPNLRLHRTPYAPECSLEALLSSAICVVLPFRRFTLHPQLAVLESLDAGLPVVIADVDCAKEMVRHGRTGLVVPPGDVNGTVEAVDALLRDRDRAGEMGRAAATSVDAHWNWDGYADALQDVYREVLH